MAKYFFINSLELNSNLMPPLWFPSGVKKDTAVNCALSIYVKDSDHIYFKRRVIFLPK